MDETADPAHGWCVDPSNQVPGRKAESWKEKEEESEFVINSIQLDAGFLLKFEFTQKQD